MIADDDSRHGTTRGFHAGCRETCCRRAMARYEKEGKYLRGNGISRAVPALGYQRRIQALMRLGWSFQDIADAAGWKHRNHVRRIIAGQKGKPTRYLERQTARTIGEVYERLSMRIPDGTFSGRTRNLAIRKGYVPPLAWDNIDDPNEIPRGYRTSRPPMTDVDPVAVERAMAGDRIQLTRDERYEVVARLRNMGRSLRWIEEHTVITKAERYLARGDAA